MREVSSRRHPEPHTGERVRHRSAASLIEVLVVIAIVAVVLGLLLSAVQQVRRSAQRTANINNIRQIVLATHNWASANGDRLPPVVLRDPTGSGGQSLFTVILPYVEQAAAYREMEVNGRPFRVPIFINPEDPSVSLSDLPPGAASYGANFPLFVDGPRYTAVTDGTTNTIAFAEHYARCASGSIDYTASVCVLLTFHRATFAETDTLLPPSPTPYVTSPDVYPFTSGFPPVSVGFLSGAYEPFLGYTFQAGPALKDCDSRRAQSPNPAGMEIALADGSVRLIRAEVAETVYWGLVTPRGGEAVADY